MPIHGYLPENSLPKQWDFVWCAFPLEEKPHTPGTYHRPVLVRSSIIWRDPKDDVEKPWVNLVYCTKQVDLLDAHSFIIDDAADKTACGLYEDTLVRTDRQRLLPWHSKYFERRQRDNIGPVIGRATDAVQTEVLKFIPNF